MDTNDGAPVKDCDAFRNLVGKFTWRDLMISFFKSQDAVCTEM